MNSCSSGEDRVPKVSAEHREGVRTAILDAAFECLVEHGANGVTARAIAARAGLSPGTIYLYFDGKDDLFPALAERVATIEVDLLAGSDDQPAIDRLRTVVERVLAHHDHVVAATTLRELAARDDAVRAALERFDRTVVMALAPLVRRAIEDGSLRADLDAEAVIEAVDIFSEGLATRRFVTSRDRVTRAFLNLLLEGSLA
jgi:AcrR family transcriptional regulator